MTRVRVASFAISLDGYGAGPNQDIDNPLGAGGTDLHQDVRLGGGPHTVQQYLRAGLVDELHLAIAPVLLGAGERLFEGVDLRSLGYSCVEHVASEKATHVVLRRREQSAA